VITTNFDEHIEAFVLAGTGPVTMPYAAPGRVGGRAAARVAMRADEALAAVE
jgi:hypothetical protein